MSAGIVGYGVYIPRYRLASSDVARVWGGSVSGVKEKSVTGSDEDAVTMAVEAVQSALRHSGVAPDNVRALYAASVSGPNAVKSMAAQISEVVGLPVATQTSDFGGSTRAGTAALRAALDSLAARPGYVIVACSDFQWATPGDLLEHSLGAGAAALVIGSNDVIAEIEDSASAFNTYTYTWRNFNESYVRRYDDPRTERAYGYVEQVGGVVSSLLKTLARKATDYHRLALHMPDGQAPGLVAKKLGLKPESIAGAGILASCGETGCSSMFLSLAAALDAAEPGDRILAAGYGSGSGADAFSVAVTPAIKISRNRSKPVKGFLADKKNIEYTQYQKRVGILNMEWLPVPMSSYVAQPGWELEKEFELCLNALKCRACGSLNFPRRSYCIDCRGEEFDVVPLPRQGTISSFNVQHLVAVAPEEAPIAIVVAKMDGATGKYGGSIASMMVDCDLDKVKIGMRVELIFRRCGQEQGLVKYGWKFRPVEAVTQNG